MEKNTELITSFFKKVKPSLFKVKKHPLRKSENYAKEIYVTMLYTIAGADRSIDEAQQNFVERLADEIKLHGESSDYIKNASDIDEKTLSEFLNIFSGDKLSHNFFVDSMILLSCSDKVSDKAIKLLSEYASVLKIETEEIKSLNRFSEIILDRNEDEYHEWIEEKSDKIKLKNFLYYIKEVATGRIIKEEDYEYWFGKFEINESESIRRKNIKIKDAEITLSEDVKLEFQSCDKIKIKDSKLRGHHGLYIENSRKVEIDDSKFEGFKSRAVHLKNIVKLEIEDSEFIDCSYTSTEHSACGGAIYVNDIEKLYIDESIFKDCSVKGDIEKGVYGAAIYMEDQSLESKIKFKENLIVNCYCYSDNGNVYEAGGAIKGDRFKKSKEKILKDNKFQGCSSDIR